MQIAFTLTDTPVPFGRTFKHARLAINLIGRVSGWNHPNLRYIKRPRIDAWVHLEWTIKAPLGSPSGSSVDPLQGWLLTGEGLQQFSSLMSLLTTPICKHSEHMSRLDMQDWEFVNLVPCKADQA